MIIQPECLIKNYEIIMNVEYDFSFCFSEDSTEVVKIGEIAGSEKKYIFAGKAIFETAGRDKEPFSVLVFNFADEDELFFNALTQCPGSSYTDIKRADILKFAIDILGLDLDTCKNDICALIGISPSLKKVAEYLQFFSAKDEVQQMVRRGHLRFKDALSLSSFAPDAQMVFVDKVLFSLKLSTSEVRIAVESIVSLCRRNNLTIRDWFSQNEYIFDEISSLEVKAGSRFFLDFLKKELNPIISTLESQFDEIRKELNFSKKTKIVHDPFFEEDGVRLIADLKNIDDLRNLVLDLNKKVELFKKLFEMDADVSFKE